MARVRCWLFCHHVSWYLNKLSMNADLSFSSPSSPPSWLPRSGWRLGPALRALMLGFRSLSLPVWLYLCTRARRSIWRPSRSISLKSPPVLFSWLIKVHSRISSVPSTRSIGLALSQPSAAFHSCTVVRGTSMCSAMCVTRQPIQYSARALRRLSWLVSVKARSTSSSAASGVAASASGNGKGLCWPWRKRVFRLSVAGIPTSLGVHSRACTCAFM